MVARPENITGDGIKWYWFLFQ